MRRASVIDTRSFPFLIDEDIPCVKLLTPIIAVAGDLDPGPSLRFRRAEIRFDGEGAIPISGDPG